jgi:hypothetical protein
MSTLGKTEIPYSDALAALGRFISEQAMSDVCVMEFSDGVIVTGTKIHATGEILSRHIATHVLSNEQVMQLVKGSKHAAPRP